LIALHFDEKNYKEDIVIMLNIFICGRLVS